MKLVALFPNDLPPLFTHDKPDLLMMLQGTDDESHQHSHAAGDHAHSHGHDEHDGHSHDHSHHGHGHGHSHSHTNLNAVQKLIQRVSKVVGIAAIADAWRENLTVVCVSSVLLLLGALAPLLFPNSATTSSLQSLLVIAALPLTGVYSSHQNSLFFLNGNHSRKYIECAVNFWVMLAKLFEFSYTSTRLICRIDTNIFNCQKY